MDRLGLHHHATLIAVILCDESHWALMLMRRGDDRAFVFDGLRKATIMEQARAFAVMASEKHKAKYEVVQADVALQGDAWSCAHRALCTLDAVLSQWTGVTWSWPPELGAGLHSDEALQSMCTQEDEDDDHPRKSEEPLLNAVVAAGESFGQSAEDHFGAVAGPAAASKRAREEVSEQVIKEAPQKRSKATGCTKKVDHLAMGKKKAAELGIDYSITFQKAHYSIKAPIKPGHWDKFLEQLSRGNVMKRRACAAVRDTKRQEAAAVAAAEGPSPEASQLLPAHPAPAAPVDMPEDHKGKHGRPPRGQRAPQLLDWMGAHRADVYRHIHGARYYCRACNEEKYFVREALGGRQFVLGHEKVKKHKLGLQNLADEDDGRPLLQALAAPAELKPCEGIQLSKATGELGRMVQAMKQWMSQGSLQFLSESSPGKGSLHVLEATAKGEEVILRHTCCKRAEAVDAACADCLSLLRNRSMLESIAHWVRRLDQAELLYLCVYDRTKVFPFLEEMLEKDYAKWSKKCNKEIERCVTLYDNLGIPALHDHCFRQWVCHPQNNVTDAIRKYIDRHVHGLHLPDVNDDEQLALQVLTQRMSQCLEDGDTDHEQLALASWVAAGNLQKHTAVHALVQCFVHAEKKIARGCTKRPGRALDASARMEILSSLGSGKQTLELLQMFHVSEKEGHATINFHDPLLPSFFCSHKSMLAQKRSCSQIRNLLGSTGEQRLLCIAIDETVWRPTFEAVAHLQPDNAYSIVGGAWSPDKDCSILQRGDARSEQDLSRLSLSIIVSRIDTNRFTFDMDFVPLRQGPGQRKAEVFLDLLGQCLAAFRAAGSGIPPLSIAFDNGGSNSLVNLALLGLLSKDELQQYDFFRDCKVAPTEIGIKLFPFKVLRHGKWFLTGCNDSYHCLKNWTLQHTAGNRTIMHGLFPVDFQDMRNHGLPLQSFICRDPQSDRASGHRLCPAFFSETWLSDGLILFAFIGNLMSSCWNCCLSPEATFVNAATAFYLLMLHISEAKRVHGDGWKTCTAPFQTVRNCLHLMAHAMLSCVFTCTGPWRLASRQERFAESHFSKVKSLWRGSPSIRDGLFGTHLEHFRAVSQLKHHTWPACAEAQPVCAFTAAELSEEALRNACFWQSAVSKRAAASIRHDLLSWYQVEGRAFLTANRQVDGWAEDST